MADVDMEWYAVRVGARWRSGRQEFVTSALLKKKGFAVFLPTKMLWRKKSKYRAEKHLVTYPLLVGWIFAGWPVGETRWGDLFSTNGVFEVAGGNGQPCPIPDETMEVLFRRWGRGVCAPKAHGFMRTHKEFSTGDFVVVAEGAFEGHEARVVDLNGPQARVLLDFLGSVRKIEVPTQALERCV